MIFRGNGYLAPLICIASVLILQVAKPSRLLYTSVTTFALLVGGVWVAWYGWRRLLAAQQKLERPLHWYEWVFDANFWKPQPFDSFMLIQMPWWSLAYAALIIFMLGKMFS